MHTPILLPKSIPLLTPPLFPQPPATHSPTYACQRCGWIVRWHPKRSWPNAAVLKQGETSVFLRCLERVYYMDGTISASQWSFQEGFNLFRLIFKL